MLPEQASQNPKQHLLNMSSITEKYLHYVILYLILSMWKPENIYRYLFLLRPVPVMNKELKNVFINFILLLITCQKGSLSLYGSYAFIHYVKAQLFRLQA